MKKMCGNLQSVPSSLTGIVGFMIVSNTARHVAAKKDEYYDIQYW